MLAMKSPSKVAFEKAIDACAEASMIHLEAMANERYAAYLMEAKETELAKDYLTKSYWLYQEWGAHGKNFLLSQQHHLLWKLLYFENLSHFTLTYPLPFLAPEQDSQQCDDEPYFILRQINCTHVHF